MYTYFLSKFYGCTGLGAAAVLENTCRSDDKNIYEKTKFLTTLFNIIFFRQIAFRFRDILVIFSIVERQTKHFQSKYRFYVENTNLSCHFEGRCMVYLFTIAKMTLKTDSVGANQISSVLVSVEHIRHDLPPLTFHIEILIFLDYYFLLHDDGWYGVVVNFYCFLENIKDFIGMVWLYYIAAHFK